MNITLIDLPVSYWHDYYTKSFWDKRLVEQEKNLQEVRKKYEGVSFDACSQELKRAEEIYSSSSEQYDFVELQTRRMSEKSRQPVINGINYGRMLDDLKKDLHIRINDRFENERIESDKKFREDNIRRELMDSVRWALTRLPDLAKACATMAEGFNTFAQALHNEVYGPGRVIRFDKGSPDRDRAVVAMVGEKGREILSHDEVIKLPDYKKAAASAGYGVTATPDPEDEDDLYEAVYQFRKRNGYYDPFYLKLWKKIKKLWTRVK